MLPRRNAIQADPALWLPIRSDRHQLYLGWEFLMNFTTPCVKAGCVSRKWIHAQERCLETDWHMNRIDPGNRHGTVVHATTSRRRSRNGSSSAESCSRDR
jgi:hypothetical protein